MNFQPLRITSGWQVEWNTFMEVDPSANTMEAFEGSSLLLLFNENLNRHIDLAWRPEGDVKGQYIIQILNSVPVLNPQNNKLEREVNWEQPYLVFESHNRIEVVTKLEQLMLQLPAHEDPRILKSPGIPDEPSESFRLELGREGISPDLIHRIVLEGNSKIQSLLLDNEMVPKDAVEVLLERGSTKGVRKKAEQMLRSKKFR